MHSEKELLDLSFSEFSTSESSRLVILRESSFYIYLFSGMRPGPLDMTATAGPVVSARNIR
jgi:hypothetical protein